MKAVIIGGGAGGRAVLEMFSRGQLEILNLELLGVVDINPDAPAMRLAREQGLSALTDIEKAMLLDGLELVIELTGSEEVLDQIFFNMPPGVRVMDHVMARVFWDLERVNRKLRVELREKTKLESRAGKDRALLQEILDNLPDAVLVLDQDKRIRRVNRRFEEVTGRSRAEVEGKRCEAGLFLDEGGEGCDHCHGLCRMVMENGERATQILHSGDGSGAERYYRVIANPVFDEDGRVIRVIHTSREITEQVKLKHESEELAHRFRQIVNNVHGIITIKDLDGRYQLVNPRAEQLCQLSQDQMIGHTANELFDPETAALINACDQEALKRGGYYASEETMTVAGKQRILVSERLPLKDYRDQVVAICCISRDDTKRRQLQQDLVQAERLGAVGKLAAGVAHELNNPLTGILTFAEDLLLEADPEDPAHQDYELIVNETMRCRHIVRDLLDFSRQKAPERRLASINPVIERTLTLVERQASFHNIDFKLELCAELPQVNIDTRQMQQTILNLVINARDSMKASGDISISSEVINGGNWVAISVSDSGCGIPADQLEEIFQPFFTTKGDQGNGLGLPAVQGVVEQHGGRVEVTSVVGQGSTFRVILPAAGD